MANTFCLRCKSTQLDLAILAVVLAPCDKWIYEQHREANTARAKRHQDKDVKQHLVFVVVPVDGAIGRTFAAAMDARKTTLCHSSPWGVWIGRFIVRVVAMGRDSTR